MSAALISVSDKTGILPLAHALTQAGMTILSTGGTAVALRNAHIPVEDLEGVTGFPELLGGRVKTLHPKIHGGILWLRGNEEHERQRQAFGLPEIRFVAVNLYPFGETIRKPGVAIEEAIEQIDIGGCALARSAAKNCRDVTVVVDPRDYPEVIRELARSGETSLGLRQRLAVKAFAQVSAYDAAIAGYLQEGFGLGELPAAWSLPLVNGQALRYGENPHQRGTLYGEFWRHFQQLHGKELSYNNLLDIDSGVGLLADFPVRPTVAILKHNTPCGIGSAETLHEAWEKALATDREAPFGGVVAANRPVDLPFAETLSGIFTEVVIAPGFDPQALVLLQKKKNLRLLCADFAQVPSGRFSFRSIVADSILAQERDTAPLSSEARQVVSRRSPTPEEREAMEFSWRVCKHVRSNAIVFGAADRTLGIGAGQMSRVDAVRVAIAKAKNAGLSLAGSALASDAYFPFPDSVVHAAEAGATAVIQPGGSIRDPEVIAAADERGLALVFTGRRHFRH
ncbi:bifunctional phosphoribosylaminoimidazolecarboxamide formyltransferase/IMP cyclohydrolase [Methylacidimicrobium sp. B4]|uniref:bifunctional phosphoribosylaminoimidazolecarboxamide formyltransferase/IMP cyclohydrolase n=1 Tax=Methylacidimicrobium sp. B4 TaxID=2796139 RepID=UPI001A8F4FAF|nr:bifunctional phosphoribosylaminoimidazolecarboxamide formyltransferase/IMP cyclohydrolase [Methylacidimicrobium sp. B4]QSR84339.1 bifunctional phosphoribosylaminoimidazolecarboxamide formyltransferase/IMP cyclohydrolase [Methylacidimicrobium sp. B4]